MRMVYMNKLFQRLKSNQAFFMPTVTIFLMVFLTFITWQANQVLAYQGIAINYQDTVYQEVVLKEIEKKISRQVVLNALSVCIPQYVPSIPTFTSDYKIYSSVYCVRRPDGKDVVPASKQVLGLFETIDRYDEEISNTKYRMLQAKVLSIVGIQTTNGWIGIPFDAAVKGPLKAFEYALIMTMPRQLIFDYTIIYKEKKVKLMVIYDYGDNEIKRVHYT